MLSLVRLLPVRQLSQKPLRPLIALLGVALGVALFVAIDLINTATLGFFRGTVDAVTGKASLSVLGGDTGMPEEKLEVVKSVAGVKSAVPLVEARGTYTAADGKKETLAIFGVDFLAESAVRSYSNASNENILDDPLVFLNQAESIIVTQSFAKTNGLANESKLEMMTAFGLKTFVVRGFLAPTGTAKAFGKDLAIMDIDGARVMFGKEGHTDRIDIVPEPGADVEALAHALEAALGQGYRVERPEAQAETLGRMIAGYQGVLTFVSGLAFLGGFFLLVNAIAMSVTERRAEIGILRALGASRARLLSLLVTEALILGLLGTALGIALGRAASSLLVVHVSRSMAVQYSTPITAADLKLGADQIVRALVLGTVAAALAAAWPAYRVTRIPTSQAVTKSEPFVTKATSRGRAVIGIALLAYLPLSARISERFPALAPLSAVAAVGGAILAGPVVATALLSLLRRLLVLEYAPRANILRLACENLLRDPRRTGNQLLSLFVGLVLVVVIATIHRSFAESEDRWLHRTFRADLVISSSGRTVTFQMQPLHEDLAQEIDTIPGVSIANGRGARGFRFVQVPYGGRPVLLKAWDESHPALNYSIFDIVKGSPEAGRLLYASPRPTAIVSEAFGAHFGKTVGDTIELATPTGPLRLEIIATVVDFGSPNGVIHIPRDLYKRYWNDKLVNAFEIQVAPGVTPGAVRDEVSARMGSHGIVAVLHSELRAQLMDLLDESFTYTRAIELAALLVGLLGLFNTALASALDRMRELGMLRAIGMSRSQLVRLMLAEATLLGVTGGMTAVALGIYISYCWVVGALTGTLGWVISVYVPWGSALLTIALGFAVGGIAGLLVAARTSNIQIREALAYD